MYSFAVVKGKPPSDLQVIVGTSLPLFMQTNHFLSSTAISIDHLLSEALVIISRFCLSSFQPVCLVF